MAESIIEVKTVGQFHRLIKHLTLGHAHRVPTVAVPAKGPDGEPTTNIQVVLGVDVNEKAKQVTLISGVAAAHPSDDTDLSCLTIMERLEIPSRIHEDFSIAIGEQSEPGAYPFTWNRKRLCITVTP